MFKDCVIVPLCIVTTNRETISLICVNSFQKQLLGQLLFQFLERLQDQYLLLMNFKIIQVPPSSFFLLQNYSVIIHQSYISFPHIRTINLYKPFMVRLYNEPNTIYNNKGKTRMYPFGNWFLIVPIIFKVSLIRLDVSSTRILHSLNY